MERNVPKLRFKGFNDEWENKKLGEFLTFYSTNSFSRDCLNYENGDAQNIHYGDIHMKFPTILDTEKYNIPYINSDINISKYSEESFCKDGDLVIADASEDYADIGKSIEVCNIGNKKILAGLHTILARDNKLVTVNGFKGYMMQSESVRKQVKVLAAGAKVLGISKSNLEKVNVKLPSLQEQERISNFLNKVDKIIEKQDEKVKNLEKYKKGMMQKIFSQEIRFKDENGEEYPEWEEARLNNVLSISEKIKTEIIEKDKLLTVKLHMQGIKVNKNVDTLNIGATVYYKRKAGQFIYGKQNFFNGAFGIVPEELDGYLSSGDIPALNINRDRIIPEYLINYIGRTEFYKKTENLSSGTGSKRIHEKTLLEIVINIPCVAEQERIANFLSNIDLVIDKENKKLEELKRWKKGLLQQMFV